MKQNYLVVYLRAGYEVFMTERERSISLKGVLGHCGARYWLKTSTSRPSMVP